MANAQSQEQAIQSLVPAAAAGDRRALQDLINLIHPPVVRYCRARVGADKYPTADDIAQEICLAVARAMDGYVDKGLPFMAFVYRVAANKIVDARRSQSRDHSHPMEELPDEEVTKDTPETQILELDACNDVKQLLDLLSDKVKEILTLRIFGGYTAEETAEILGMSAGAVRVAQFRALAKLKKHLEASQSSDAPQDFEAS